MFDDLNPNSPPVAAAGEDQSIACVVVSTDVLLDGSASSDPDNDVLTYSWSLGGSEVSTDASFTATLAVGSYTYTLTVDDQNGESATDEVLITVVGDTEAPSLTLLGDNPASVQLYTSYTEGGFEAEDVCDDNVTVVVSGTIDFNIPGSYTLTYTATDASTNSSVEERVVEVVNTAPEVAAAPSDITLSFGDDILSGSIDLSPVFADVDTSDVLTYSYTNEDEGVASSSLTGSLLSFDAVDLGETAVTITAVDPWGAEATAYLLVTVDVTSDLAGSLLFAYSEIKIKKEVEVFSGNILVNEAYGEGLGRRGHGGGYDDDEDDDDNDDHGDDDGDDDDDNHYELKIEKDVVVAGGYMLKANGIQIKKDASISSDVHANELDSRGDIFGDIYTDVQTPLFTNLPPFKSAPAGSQNITVNKNQEVILEPGDYGRINVKDRGTLTFTGGVYNIEKLEAKKSARVRFGDASEVRVSDEVKIGKQSYVGPAEGSLINASNIIFYIAGDNHHAFKIEEDVNFFGTIYAISGEVEIKKEVSFTGAILADEIEIDKEAEMWLHSFFGGADASLGKGARTAWVEPEMEYDIPESFALAANYPNPFNPSTTIDFALKDAGHVSLKIYDIRGAQVAELVQGYRDAGHYSVHFSPDNLSSGTYLYVLDAGSFREVKRMVYLK